MCILPMKGLIFRFLALREGFHVQLLSTLTNMELGVNGVTICASK